MPTINEYTNQAGYYIRARPSDASGTVTYKISSVGYPIIDDMDFADGEQIAWDTIQALKSIGLVYTDGSGTIPADEFDPDSDQFSKLSLSETEAKRLISAIQRHTGFSEGELSQISSVLGVDSVPSPKSIESEQGSSPDVGEPDIESVPTVDDHTPLHDLVEGQAYSGTVDRISNNGNGIVTTKNSLVNLGKISPHSVGVEVLFRYQGSGKGDLKTSTSYPESVGSSEYPGLTESDEDLLDKL